IRTIVARGHEVASHGWSHRRVMTLDRGQFADEVRRSKAALEDAGGSPVDGFRAPSFSIVRGTEWAFDVLVEAGYRYESGIFPIRRPGYGYPGAPRTPNRIDRPGGSLVELPLTTWVVGPLQLPAAGGGYLRQLPFGLIQGAFQQAEQRGGGVFYVHPW